MRVSFSPLLTHPSKSSSLTSIKCHPQDQYRLCNLYCHRSYLISQQNCGTTSWAPHYLAAATLNFSFAYFMSAADSPTPMQGQVAGPSTPTARRTASNHLEEDYFGGVPGAPGRKLRSQPKHISEGIQRERQSRAKGVAKLLTFDDDDRPPRKSEERPSCLTPYSDRRGDDDDADRDDGGWSIQISQRNIPRLQSPALLENMKDPSTRTNEAMAPPLRRSYTTCTCTDDLIVAGSEARPKKARLHITQQDLPLRTTRSSSFARMHNVSMRRAESASSRCQSIASNNTSDKPRESSWISDTIVTTPEPHLQHLTDFIAI